MLREYEVQIIRRVKFDDQLEDPELMDVYEQISLGNIPTPEDKDGIEQDSQENCLSEKFTIKRVR